MKSSSVLGILAIAILSCSCTGGIQKRGFITVEGDDITIKTERVPCANDILFPRNCFLLQDSILAVYEPKNHEGFVQFYNEKSFEHLGSFGNIGEGPDDYVSPTIIIDFSKAIKGRFTVGDVRKLCMVDIDSVLTKDDYKGRIYAELPQSLRLYNSLLFYSDTLIIVNQTGEYQLTYWRGDSEKVIRSNFFRRNEDLAVLDLNLTTQVYSASYASNHERIAIAYRNWKQIDILSFNGEVINRLRFADDLYNQDKLEVQGSSGNVSLAPNGHIFFTKLLSNAEHLFAICWDATKADIKSGIAKSKVYQLDWSGNLIHTYAFDKAISGICLQGNRIKYAIGISQDNPEVTLYSCHY